MPLPKKVHDGGSYQDQPKPIERGPTEVAEVVHENRILAALATVVDQGELYRFTSIGCIFRLRKLPSQPMLPERIILERRVSHLHEKEEWDIEWRQQ